jgi:hypothetical protein
MIHLIGFPSKFIGVFFEFRYTAQDLANNRIEEFSSGIVSLKRGCDP